MSIYDLKLSHSSITHQTKELQWYQKLFCNNVCAQMQYG